MHRKDSQLFQSEHLDDDDDVGEEEDKSADEEAPLYNFKRRRNAENMIIRHALKSRLAVFLVGTLASFAGHFDTSGSLLIDHVPLLLQCPANWDGAFYVRIAVDGYQYENMHAFFPMLPLIMRFLTFICPLGWATSNQYLAAAFLGAVWSVFVFGISAIVLFRLGCIVLGNDRLAMRAALLFCYNPASIFFSVAYSEATFAFFAFSGMLCLARDTSFRSRIMATLFFAVATLTRSNGSLLGLFSLWAAYQAFKANSNDQYRYIRAVVELGIVGGIHLLALISVLGYGWLRYCYMGSEDTVRPPWCQKLIPNIYSYVQDRYWNVGFLRYYEPKQIPNFLLAAPAFFISSEALLVFTREKAQIPWPYLFQLLISMVTGAFFMHVQVFTRFIAASSPLFYWYAASLTMRQSAISFLVIFYFAFYSMFGSAMFCAYFPWT